MQDPGLLELASIMTDLWDWLKKHYDVKDTDEFWAELLASGNALGEMHNRHPLGDQLIVDCAKYLEGMVKK